MNQNTTERLLENAQLIRWVAAHARDLAPILIPSVQRCIQVLAWCEDNGSRSRFAIAGAFNMSPETIKVYLRVLEVAELIDRVSSGEPSGLPVEVGGRPIVLAVLRVSGAGDSLQLKVEPVDPGDQLDLGLGEPASAS